LRKLRQDLPGKQVREIVYQVFYIGAKSTNIVMLIGLFTGMSLAFSILHADKVWFRRGPRLGIALSLIRELARPYRHHDHCTGRSSMAAEIGILRISEQIDALYTCE